PLRCFMQAIEHVVLAEGKGQRAEGREQGTAGPDPMPFAPCSMPAKRRLVICIDEIDSVRSLPFSTDEFFAAIRECYNRRSVDAEYNRLTFCLLGVATPADLITDPRTTPFNIGRRIELTDFTEAEAAPLALGFTYVLDGERVFHQSAEAEALLKRVLYWTGGHPYLTQRLCSALAAGSDNGRRTIDDGSDVAGGAGRRTSVVGRRPIPHSAIPNPQSVDRLVEAIFFARSADVREDN